MPMDTERTFRPCITPRHRIGGTPGGLVQGRAWEIIEPLLPGARVLDYASGAGHWGIRMAQAGADVSGFDLSPIGIERANLRARNAGVRASFTCADATSLPYPAESFDLVVGIQALHHTVKYAGMAHESHRVMRHGGIAVFTENIGRR
jgi:ubiquinone/menaquinone biosynthesis C-methylase UbiE